jgi:hypothetical protein
MGGEDKKKEKKKAKDIVCWSPIILKILWHF